MCDEIYRVTINITYIIVRKLCVIIKFVVIKKLTNNNNKNDIWIWKKINQFFGVINDSHIQLLHHM
jgi:hypothetical protein